MERTAASSANKSIISMTVDGVSGGEDKEERHRLGGSGRSLVAWGCESAGARTCCYKSIRLPTSSSLSPPGWLLPTPSPSTLASPASSAMAQDNRPPLPSSSPNPSGTLSETTLNDPFADRPRHINFQESTFPTPSQSVTSLPNEFGTLEPEYDEESEKLLHPRGAQYPYVLDLSVIIRRSLERLR